MRVWTCNSFKGFWPVGASAAVVAESEDAARQMLDCELRRIGLTGLRETDELVELEVDAPGVRILQDGEY